MSEHNGPRDDNTFLVCEYTGEMAGSRGPHRPGVCPEHGGDACLIVVGWVGKDWPQFREPVPEREPTEQAARELTEEMVERAAAAIEGMWPGQQDGDEYGESDCKYVARTALLAAGPWGVEAEWKARAEKAEAEAAQYRDGWNMRQAEIEVLRAAVTKRDLWLVERSERVRELQDRLQEEVTASNGKIEELQAKLSAAPALKPLDREAAIRAVARELASLWQSAVLDTDSLMLLLAERLLDAALAAMWEGRDE